MCFEGGIDSLVEVEFVLIADTFHEKSLSFIRIFRGSQNSESLPLYSWGTRIDYRHGEVRMSHDYFHKD